MSKRHRPRLGGGRGVTLLAPACGLLGVVFILPMLDTAWVSLHASLGRGRVGTDLTWATYANFLLDPFYLMILLNSLRLALITVALTVVLGYPVAYVLARTTSRHRGLLTALVAAPLMVSILIRNLGWLPLLGLDGTINTMLLRLGVIAHPLLLANNETGVTIGLVHALLPYMILTLTAVIRSIAPEIEQASISLGARPVETFFRIVLPLSRRD